MSQTGDTQTKGNADMNAETDRAGYYATLSKLTGHSVRYLRVRTAVRLAVALVPFSSAFMFALTK